MKKSVFAVLVVVFVVSAFGAFAAAPAAKPAAAPAAAKSMLMGSVASIDEKAMSFVVTGADAKDTTVFWTKETKVTGGKLAVGANVDVTWMAKDGKNWASAVKIEAPKAPAKK